MKEAVDDLRRLGRGRNGPAILFSSTANLQVDQGRQMAYNLFLPDYA